MVVNYWKLIDTIDATTAQAHRSAAGGKGGRKRKLSAVHAEGAQPRSTRSATHTAGLSPSR